MGSSCVVPAGERPWDQSRNAPDPPPRCHRSHPSESRRRQTTEYETLQPAQTSKDTPTLPKVGFGSLWLPSPSRCRPGLGGLFRDPCRRQNRFVVAQRRRFADESPCIALFMGGRNPVGSASASPHLPRPNRAVPGAAGPTANHAAVRLGVLPTDLGRRPQANPAVCPSRGRDRFAGAACPAGLEHHGGADTRGGGRCRAAATAAGWSRCAVGWLGRGNCHDVPCRRDQPARPESSASAGKQPTSDWSI